MNLYIDKLIQNIESHNNYKINLIMDGGAFSGSYILGCLYYIKSLEDKDKIKINKLSGCSIGSILSVLYLLNELDYCRDVYGDIRDHFKNNGNLYILIESIEDIKKKMKNNFYIKCNNRLYISYYNIENNKYIVQSKFKNNDDLCEAIIKSCYIPYICGSSFYYKNKYIDGLKPYLFKKGKSLFINLCMDYKCINGMFNIKNEINNYERIICGILDVHSFFLKGKSSSMCFYLDEITITQQFLHLIRLLIINLGVNILSFGYNVNNIITMNIQLKDKMYKNYSNIIINSKKYIYDLIKFYYV